MNTLSIWLLISALPFIPSVPAACSYSGDNPAYVPELADLRTPTPLTWTLSYYAIGCDTDIQTYTDNFSFFVSGKVYTPLASVTGVVSASSNQLYETFTYPQLIVTILTPGETLTVIAGASSIGTHIVPLTALTNPPTTRFTSSTFASSTSQTTSFVTSSSSSVPTTTSSSAPAPSPSSASLPVGGIVAGSVVGGVAIIAIIAFAWYKTRTHRATAPPAASESSPYGDTSRKEEVHSPNYDREEGQTGFQERVPIRYPENVSANLRTE